MKASKEVVRKYHKKLAKALASLKKNAWYGKVWSSYYTPGENVNIVNVKDHYYTVVADASLSSKEVFEKILEGSNAPTFRVELNGCSVEHSSFKFSCTVEHVVNNFMGHPIGIETTFKGSYDDLYHEHPNFTKVTDIKVIWAN